MLALLAGCQSPTSTSGAPPQDAPSAADLPSDASPADAPIDAAKLVPDAMPDAMPDASVPLPDLTFRYGQMAASIRVTMETFATDDCALDECLSAAGVRKLVRFDTIVANVGTADLMLGAPGPDTAQWEYDSCHEHYHYIDFANYQLVDREGDVVAIGHKQSFCLRDNAQVIGNAPSSGYDCARQGLSIGWADIYRASLDCQFVDVTDVPPGTYRLRVELNQERTIVESRYDNDVAVFTVVID